MGFYRQPNDWTCGPFALKHALVTLGRLADEDSIARVAHPHWWAGTDEVKLARAARHFDCDLPLVRREDPERAFGTLVRYVAQGLPVILCVDDWGHWVTVVRYQNERFVVIDSKDEPVLQVMSWRELRNRWKYTEWEEYDDERDAHPTYYDLHPVKPRYRVPVKAHFSVERAQHLRRPENADLATYWDEYLADLMEICRPRRYRGSSALSMGEFLRRNQELLVSRVRFWHGEIERTAITRVLRNFRFVAETYGLVIPSRGSRQALIDMVVLITLWAAAKGGVGSMYGAGE